MFQNLQSIVFSPENMNVFGVFVLIGALLCLFGVWYEGKKDGFDDERLFDLFLISFFGALFFGKIAAYLLDPFTIKKINDVSSFIFSANINFAVTLLVFLYIAVAVAKKWKWSVYRVLDIFALGLSFFAGIISLGFVVYTQEPEFLFIFTLYILFYSIFSTIRNHKIKSGLTFALFCIFTGILLFILYRPEALPIVALLITIGAVVTFLRYKKHMTMQLPQEFIEKMKKRLLAKDSQLAKEEKTIQENDPYLTYKERESDNAELVEDATEDILHENQQMQLSIVQKSRAQIKRALTKITNDTYGVSDVSGKPIPQERLEAYPEATTLVDEPDPQTEIEQHEALKS